jgi:hypothetical protein
MRLREGEERMLSALTFVYLQAVLLKMLIPEQKMNGHILLFKLESIHNGLLSTLLSNGPSKPV